MSRAGLVPVMALAGRAAMAPPARRRVRSCQDRGKSLLVRGLNALAATISTPLGAPVIAATRLRGGSAVSARGAASFAAEAVRTVRGTGCSRTVVVRVGSASCSAVFARAVRAAGARFSVTMQMNSHVTAAIAAIGEDA